jgi:quercetin dioxygenase-like cupin family protein
MKEHVPFLDTNAMPWTVGEFPGLFTKMLSANAKTGARTALQCIDPARGYKPPTVAHYHPDMDEELYILKGNMSFDGKNWLRAGAYCFHPGNTVHGFKSTVTEESWFLSRISRPLEFGFVEQPAALQPYALTGKTAERPINVLADPLKEPGWTEERNDAGEVVLRRYNLGTHPKTGEGSMLVEFMPAWRARHGAHFHRVYKEMFVARGEFTTADGKVFSAGCYSFIPPYTIDQPVVGSTGALVYVNFGGPLEFIPAAELPAAKKAS